MGRTFKPWYYNRHRNKVHVKNWYAEWQGADGETHRKKVGPDKRAAEAFLLKMEDAAARQRVGLDPTPTADLKAAPLGKLQDEYLALLAARDTGPEYRAAVADHLTRIRAGCRWAVWPDVSGDSLLLWLGKRRDQKGNGPATLNSYLRSAKGFTNWLADRFGAANPLKKLKPYPEQVDRRRSRRILTDPELGALVAAAERCPPRGRAAFSGRDRAMLYRVAAYTGLRASELAALEPESFDLAARPPVVTVEARDSKGKRVEPVPVPGHLVEVLRPWIAAKPAGTRLWPGRWAELRQQGDWLARDLRRAGVAELDARGRRVTFHSLKRRYVVGLIRAGGQVDEVRRLARHTDARTTFGYYTDENLPDLGRLADRLPPPG
jgi:integrase